MYRQWQPIQHKYGINQQGKFKTVNNLAHSFNDWCKTRKQLKSLTSSKNLFYSVQNICILLSICIPKHFRKLKKAKSMEHKENPVHHAIIEHCKWPHNSPLLKLPHNSSLIQENVVLLLSCLLESVLLLLLLLTATAALRNFVKQSAMYTFPQWLYTMKLLVFLHIRKKTAAMKKWLVVLPHRFQYHPSGLSAQD